MWVPAVLGAATVVLAYFLGRRFFSQGVGVLSAIFLSLLPAHFRYSQLGFVDHHAAVALLSLCLLWAGMRLSGQTPESEGFDWDGMRRAAPLGLAMGLALLVWLTTGLGAFALTYANTLDQSFSDRAAFTAGSDKIVFGADADLLKCFEAV